MLKVLARVKKYSRADISIIDARLKPLQNNEYKKYWHKLVSFLFFCKINSSFEELFLKKMF